MIGSKQREEITSILTSESLDTLYELAEHLDVNTRNTLPTAEERAKLTELWKNNADSIGDLKNLKPTIKLLETCRDQQMPFESIDSHIESLNKLYSDTHINLLTINRDREVNGDPVRLGLLEWQLSLATAKRDFRDQAGLEEETAVNDGLFLAAADLWNAKSLLTACTNAKSFYEAQGIGASKSGKGKEVVPSEGLMAVPKTESEYIKTIDYLNETYSKITAAIHFFETSGPPKPSKSTKAKAKTNDGDLSPLDLDDSPGSPDEDWGRADAIATSVEEALEAGKPDDSSAEWTAAQGWFDKYKDDLGLNKFTEQISRGMIPTEESAVHIGFITEQLSAQQLFWSDTDARLRDGEEEIETNLEGFDEAHEYFQNLLQICETAREGPSKSNKRKSEEGSSKAGGSVSKRS